MTINGRKQVLGAAAGLWLVCLSLLWAGLPARSAAQAGSAGAEVTALDIALIQPRAHPDDLRAVTLAFMSSEFHFVRQPDGAGGHELVKALAILAEHSNIHTNSARSFQTQSPKT